MASPIPDPASRELEETEGRSADNSSQPPDPRRTKTAFLAHLRHELRTPINAIMGYSELLREIAEEEGDTRLVTDLQRINSAGRQLLALVNDILDSSRIESQTEIRIEEFEIQVRHQLRTPISSVVGYADLLLDDAREANRQDLTLDLERIKSAGERLLTFINDILSLWQVQTGKSDLDVSASSTFQMVEDAVAAIRPLETNHPRLESAEGGSLLVVDDNETNRDLLCRYLTRDGHRVSEAENGRQALERLSAGSFDLVLLDIMMPEVNGFEVLTQVKSDSALRHIPVIMLSALDEIDSVVRCVELGADDYLPKPFNPVLLRARIGACLEKKRYRDRELAYLEQLRIEREKSLREMLEDQFKGPAQILGNSRHALQLRSQADKAATNDQPLLILGDPGTEKRIVAQLVHEKSLRAGGTFLRMDCMNVPAVVRADDGGNPSGFLQEISQMSALFGHQSGSFSFASSSRAGYLELADGGTLFLENVERLAPAVQERLVEYLQTGKLLRLGSSQEVCKDVRVIAASHLGLNEESRGGKFNPDLRSLLSAQSITVPPLRDRKRDVAAWVDCLIGVHASRLGKPVTAITKEAMNMILAYEWPNNLEELDGVVQRGVRLADGPTLTPEQIFIGLAPFEARRKFDLLRLPFLRRALESPRYPGLLQAIGVGFLFLLILSSLAGPREPTTNAAVVLAWGLWWPLMALGIILTGRFFCAVCPMGAIGRFVQLRWSLKRKVPAAVRQYGLYGAALGFMLIFWVEQITAMADSPVYTGLLLLAILTGAVSASLVFDRAAWCRYMCPLGRMIGTYATLSVVELRSNPSMCSAECKTHGCYTGTERAGGCPMYEGAFALQSNDTCKLCGECLKNCVNKAIRLNLRLPASEVLTLPTHSLALAAFVPILMATVLGVHLRATDIYRNWLGSSSLEWLAFLGVLLAIALAVGGAMALAVLAVRERLSTGLAWLPYAFLPLALAGEISHHAAPFLSQAITIPLVLGRQLGLTEAFWPYSETTGATYGVRGTLVVLGLLSTVYLSDRLLVRYRPSAKTALRLPTFFLGGFLSLAYAILFVMG